MKILTAICVSLLCLLIPDQDSRAQSFTAESGYVEFVSSAPLLEFKGTSNHLTGLINLDKNLVDFYVDLNTLDTGIDLRNNHMRESYLETDTYRFAEFTGELVSDIDPDFELEQEVTVTGTFKIHGVEREIDVQGTITPKESGLQLDAGWTILLEDYNIDKPRVVFYELASEQDVNISILLKPQD
jgi:polyisoprenoid-binding protein YceI